MQDDCMSNDVFSEYAVRKQEGMFENDFVIFNSGESRRVGIVKNGCIERAKFFEGTFNGLKPKNLEQKLALINLMDENIELTTLTGVAGTSKTLLMLASALEMIERGLYKKLYIVKAPLPLKREYQTGFKPNSHLEKMQLPLGSVTTNLYNMKNKKANERMSGFQILEGYISFGKVEIVSLEDILGMSLAENSILLVEEAQTLPIDDMKAILTRVGENSKIFLNGDLLQGASNKLIAEETGLFHVINAFAGYKKASHMTLKTVHRSGFVAELHNRWDKLK